MFANFSKLNKQIKPKYGIYMLICRNDRIMPCNNEDDIYNIILNAAKNIETNNSDELGNNSIDDYQNFYSYSRYTKNKIKGMTSKTLMKRDSEAIKEVRKNAGKIILHPHEDAQISDIHMNDVRLGKKCDTDYFNLVKEFDIGDYNAKNNDELTDIFLKRVKQSVKLLE